MSCPFGGPLPRTAASGFIAAHLRQHGAGPLVLAGMLGFQFLKRPPCPGAQLPGGDGFRAAWAPVIHEGVYQPLPRDKREGDMREQVHGVLMVLW